MNSRSASVSPFLLLAAEHQRPRLLAERVLLNWSAAFGSPFRLLRAAGKGFPEQAFRAGALFIGGRRRTHPSW